MEPETGETMASAWRAVLPAVLGLGACAGEIREAVDDVRDAPAVAEVLLVGDAGKPAPGGDPVLLAAERMAAQAPERTVVVFLGDNVYPDGMPEEPGPRRTEAERILQAQLDVPLRSGARGIFVSGNHDWDHSGPEGWEQARIQEEYIRANGGRRVVLLPGGGCPGPAVVDLPGGLRVVALDSQWWLHPHDKPRPPPDDCPATTDAAVVARLRAVLREAAGRPVVVVAHHPLFSGGTHGVFPLLPTRYAPLPRFSAQDLGHPLYRHMRRVLHSAFAEHPPLVHAAGHDHNLQLLRTAGAQFQVVSGTGIFGHTGRVRHLPGTLYARRASGFMRLSLRADGAVRLDAFTVDSAGGSRRDFSRVLRPGR